MKSAMQWAAVVQPAWTEVAGDEDDEGSRTTKESTERDARRTMELVKQ